MNLVLGVITVYSSVFVAQSGTWNDSKSLMTDLFSSYDHRLRPVNDQSKPVKVNFTFDLMSIQDLDEVEGTLSVVGFMHLSWYDEKLIWNSSEYGDTFSLTFPIDDVWHPTIVLSNSFKQIKAISNDWMVVHIWSGGWASYYPGDVFTSSCLTDVTFYPFDYQTCFINFVSWGFPTGVVSLHLWSQVVFKTYFTENGEWSLINMYPYRSPGRNEFEVDSVGVSLTIKRRSTFLVVNVILPVVFMSMINILVFLLPTESGERVSYALTVLLSLAIFLTLVVNNLPKTSKPIAILCYYLMCILVASVLMCVVTIGNLRVFYMNQNIAVPNWCSRLCKVTCIHSRSSSAEVTLLPSAGVKSDNNENETIAPSTSSRHSWRDVSRALDRFFFFFFLGTLIIVNGVYLSALSSNHMGN